MAGGRDASQSDFGSSSSSGNVGGRANQGGGGGQDYSSIPASTPTTPVLLQVVMVQ